MPAVAVIVLQRSALLSELLEDKVGVKGPTFEARLDRARRILPREARAAGKRISAAARMARQRGGIVDVDAHAFDEDYRLLLRHLNEARPDRMRLALLHGLLQGMATAGLSGLLLGLGLALAGWV